MIRKSQVRRESESTEPEVRRVSRPPAKITMAGDDGAGLSGRLHKAWQAFHEHKYILCYKNCSIKQRLLLVERTITPGVLRGSRVVESA